MVDIAAISYYVVVEACLVAWWPLSFVGQAVQRSAVALQCYRLAITRHGHKRDCEIARLQDARAGGGRSGGPHVLKMIRSPKRFHASTVWPGGLSFWKTSVVSNLCVVQG